MPRHCSAQVLMLIPGVYTHEVMGVDVGLIE